MRIAAALAAASLAGCATLPAQDDAPHRVSARVGFDRDDATTSVSGTVTADSPARIASISKLVVALGVMRLVEAGTLDLDRDVSDYLGWRLRHPEFAETPLTLRLLLSHRSGLTDGGELYLIPLGETVRDRLRDPRVWSRGRQPGTYFAYTNLNFPLIASVMEKASGERFDRLMTRVVLEPLGLEACFNWSGCSKDALARAIVLRAPDGTVVRDDLRGKPPACPVVPDKAGGCGLADYRLGDNGALFSPQGGLRISANDLARIGRLLLGRGGGFITPGSFETMTAPAWIWDGANGDTSDGLYCAYGLGVQLTGLGREGCRDDPFGDGRRRFGHAGDAYRLKSGLWIDAERGRGVAFLVTAVAEDAARGQSAYSAIEERLARGR